MNSGTKFGVHTLPPAQALLEAVLEALRLADFEEMDSGVTFLTVGFVDERKTVFIWNRHQTA